ncbi:chloride channel protein 2 [Trichonephila clavipes]|nr:chloride channel protein 2 [Trichonephila clavipes]
MHILLQDVCDNSTGYLTTFWHHTFAKLGEDWVFLAVLGILTSLISFSMDYAIAICLRTRIWLYRDLARHPLLQYMAWIAFPLTLILFSSGFVHIMAPQAIGLYFVYVNFSH